MLSNAQFAFVRHGLQKLKILAISGGARGKYDASLLTVTNKNNKEELPRENPRTTRKRHRNKNAIGLSAIL